MYTLWYVYMVIHWYYKKLLSSQRCWSRIAKTENCESVVDYTRIIHCGPCCTLYIMSCNLFCEKHLFLMEKQSQTVPRLIQSGSPFILPSRYLLLWQIIIMFAASSSMLSDSGACLEETYFWKRVYDPGTSYDDTPYTQWRIQTYCMKEQVSRALLGGLRCRRQQKGMRPGDGSVQKIVHFCYYWQPIRCQCETFMCFFTYC